MAKRTHDRATPEKLREIMRGKVGAGVEPTTSRERAPARKKTLAPALERGTDRESAGSAGTADAAATSLLTHSQPGAPSPPTEPRALPESPSTLQQIDALIDNLLARQRIAEPHESNRLQGELLRAFGAKSKLEAADAVIEDKVARHPKVARLRDAIFAALRPWPDALKAAVEACEEAAR